MRTRLRTSTLILASGQAVRLREVVAMLTPSALAAQATREFVSSLRAKGRIDESVAPARAWSAIVCTERLVLTPVSTATLLRKLR